MKVVFCIPTVKRPYRATLRALEECLPAIEAAGFQHLAVYEVGNAYISGGRALMLRKALDHLDPEHDAVVFIDHDVSWRPEDMVKLLATAGEVVAGTYRYKREPEEYMGGWHTDAAGIPVVRPSDGAIKGSMVPAGFLKVRVTAIDKLMLAYPDLCFGPPSRPSFDLFNHGAHRRVWWGEDFAFARRWAEIGGDTWLIPDMNIDHWGQKCDAKGNPILDESGDPIEIPWRGNLHQYLLARPGGSKDPARTTAATLALPSDPQPTRSDNGIPDAA